MITNRFIFLLSFLCFSGLAAPSFLTFPSDVEWQQSKSDHFIVMFRKGSDRLAERALFSAEKAFQVLDPIFPQGPELTWLVVADFQNSMNGYALPFPYPHIVLFATPPESDHELSSVDDWFYSLILHELTHIRHLYPTSGIWSVLRTIFGSWVVPNGLKPSHFHEGLAVLMETQKTTGGRGRSTAFHTWERIAVENGTWGTPLFFSQDRMDGSLLDFPHGSTPYFIGYSLFESLWEQKKEQGIYHLVEEESRSVPYLLNGPLENSHGLDYPTLWTSIFEIKKARLTQENTKIKQEPLNPLAPVTTDGQLKQGVTLSASKQWLAYTTWTREAGSEIKIIKTSDQSLYDVWDIEEATDQLCFITSAETDFLLWLEPKYKYHYSRKRLMAYDIAAKKAWEVQNEKNDLENILRLGCSAKESSILLYREFSGKGTIEEYVFSKENIKTLKSWPVPEGQWASSLTARWVGLRNGLNTEFYEWGTTPKKVLSLKGHYFSFRDGPSPTFLYAIGEFDQRNAVYEINLLKKESFKRMNVFSYTSAFDVTGNEWYAVVYGDKGFDVVKTKSLLGAKQSLTPSLAPPLPSIPTANSTFQSESYSAFPTLFPKAWVPSLLFVPSGAQIGAWIPGFDLSQKHFYDVTLGYDTRGLPFAVLDYDYRFGKTLDLNVSPYYLPQFLPSFSVFLQQWGASVGLSQELNLFTPFNLDLGFSFKKLENNVLTSQNQSVGFQIGVRKNFGYKRRPLSTTPVSGSSFSLSYGHYFKALGSTDDYFSVLGTVSQFVENPFLKEHTLLLALQAGYTEGTQLLASNFQAGGELLFSQSRNTFNNRGYVPGLFLGRRLINLNLEYQFPLFYIYRGWDYLPFRLKNISLAMVADATTFDRGYQSASPKDLLSVYYPSAGIEIRSNWVFSYYLPASVRLGFYRGFSRIGEDLYFVLGFEAGL